MKYEYKNYLTSKIFWTFWTVLVAISYTEKLHRNASKWGIRLFFSLFKARHISTEYNKSSDKKIEVKFKLLFSKVFSTLKYIQKRSQCSWSVELQWSVIFTVASWKMHFYLFWRTCSSKSSWYKFLSPSPQSLKFN